MLALMSFRQSEYSVNHKENTYKMPNKSNRDCAVGYCGEGEPNDDDDLKLLEVAKLWDHADCDGGTEATTCGNILTCQAYWGHTGLTELDNSTCGYEKDGE